MGPKKRSAKKNDVNRSEEIIEETKNNRNK